MDRFEAARRALSQRFVNSGRRRDTGRLKLLCKRKRWERFSVNFSSRSRWSWRRSKWPLGHPDMGEFFKATTGARTFAEMENTVSSTLIRSSSRKTGFIGIEFCPFGAYPFSGIPMAYAPFPIWLWLNGHEWAKRQLEKAEIDYQPLDNGFRCCEDAAALQKICNRLGPGAVKSFFWRWVNHLPSPFTEEDLRAGYVYELAFRQFEVSDTSVFDRPQAGRMWFESVRQCSGIVFSATLEILRLTERMAGAT